ncbi:hypothetical protein [Nitrosomonas sp.]|uniref:hypothetical protein n=1 Tax=Nitrosomonas sp. TaxID=42353 RepID=UPI0025ED93E8|nr:hypothetical protein [Nitrosomonas sp.]
MLFHLRTWMPHGVKTSLLQGRCGYEGAVINFRHVYLLTGMRESQEIVAASYRQS